MKFDVIIPCGGSSSRMGKDKLLLPLDGSTVIAKTVAAFFRPDVQKIVIPCPPSKRDVYAAAVGHGQIPTVFCDGGATRSQSVRNALALCDSPIVAIHDGARPFVTAKTIDEGAKLCAEKGSAIACVAPSDSVRLLSEGGSRPVDRAAVRLVQTPQFFDRKDLAAAYASAQSDGYEPTDDAQVYERYVRPVTLYEGDPRNAKLTVPEDERLLAPSGFRVGTGWDLHILVEGRRLVLGGVELPFPKGLLGHSDADVLAHAVADAVLGALGRRDIGCLFPDDDPAFEGADSMKLLAEVVRLMKKDGYRLNNLSATVICEKPKLKDVIPGMEANFAAVFGCDTSLVNIAATTSEKTGAVGQGNAIAATAFVSLAACKDAPRS